VNRGPPSTENFWIETGRGYIGAAWYWPEFGEAPPTAVLVVPGIAHEERTMAQGLAALAESLLRVGLPTLLIDLHGTAQSTGSLSDDAIGDRWRSDIRAAIGHIRQAGFSKIIVVGVRLGALLALDALGDETKLAMIAWAPVTSGRRYARELKILQGMGAHQGAPGAAAASISIAGHDIPRSVTSHLASLDMAEIVAGLPSHMLHLDSADHLDTAWVDTYREHGVAIEQSISTEANDWLLGGHDSPPVPADDIQTITRWCSRVGAADSLGAAAPPRRPTLLTEISFESGGKRIRERFVKIGPVGLTAVVTEPAESAPDGATRVLLTLVGPGRLFPEFARREAGRGKVSVRFDFSGFSTSGRRFAGHGGEFYSLSNQLDILDAVRQLQRERPEGAMLLGFCAGAWSMIQAGPQPGVVAAAAINVALYRQPDYVLKEYLLGPGSVWSRGLSFLRRFGSLSRTIDSAERNSSFRSGPMRWLKKYRESGVPLLLSFGASDLGLIYLQRRLGTAHDDERRHGRLALRSYDGLGHLTEGAPARGRMLAEVSEFFDAVDRRIANATAGIELSATGAHSSADSERATMPTTGTSSVSR